jgi:hypothetical protein
MSIKQRGLVVRGGLLLLAGEAGLIGVHALFFPWYFYNHFLFGRGWVKMLPPYNEHITRDLGALYIGFFVILGYAVLKLSKDLVNGAILGFVAATIPHMIFHIVHADDAPLLIDKVLQVGLLAITVVFGAGLALVARPLFAEQAPSRPTLHHAGAVR